MADRIYIIGHVNPDTDSIAAAMGYAWLLKEREGLDTVAARAGAINPQTTWILKRLGLEPPFYSRMHHPDLRLSLNDWIQSPKIVHYGMPGRLPTARVELHQSSQMMECLLD